MKGKSIIDIMKERHSARTFEKREISEEILHNIDRYIETLQNPFHEKIKIKIVRQNIASEGQKLGTYGVIKGASCFFIVACKDTKEGYQAVGYLFEQVVLYCTSLGLGTCFMGGTFKKGSFQKAAELENGELIAIVSPLGYEAEKNSLVGKLFS